VNVVGATLAVARVDIPAELGQFFKPVIVRYLIAIKMIVIVQNRNKGSLVAQAQIGTCTKEFIPGK
jgi:hypothetical protein